MDGLTVGDFRSLEPFRKDYVLDSMYSFTQVRMSAEVVDYGAVPIFTTVLPRRVHFLESFHVEELLASEGRDIFHLYNYIPDLRLLEGRELGLGTELVLFDDPRVHAGVVKMFDDFYQQLVGQKSSVS